MAAPVGNKFAAKAKECEQALKRALARRGDGDYRKGLDLAADKVVAAIIDDGNLQVWADLANRIDGKPVQPVEQSGVVEHEHAHRVSAETAGLLEVLRAGSGDASPEGVVPH